MNGKIMVSIILGSAAVIGAAIYYLQVFAFYEEVDLERDGVVLQMTAIDTGQPEPISIEGFQGIDANSSPLRFRGCFTAQMPVAELSERFATYAAATPTIAPYWFDCFDARQIGDALKTGAARAFLSEKNIADGVDRVIAVFNDGKAFAWHQLNEKYAE